MKIEEVNIKLSLTPREVYLISYCIDELLNITDELDLKRGFDDGKQKDCERLSLEMVKLLTTIKGEES